jgi:hypothetical protein
MGGPGCGGSTPRYRAGQAPLPGGSTPVEAPRYPPVCGRVWVAGARVAGVVDPYPSTRHHP